ncbi:hypothetical protein KTD19_11185 [Burkholderia multivorans]|uniref:hypothetical protein n=1 Tax=Burkholderia multivorans TaxID=87883 RepID=UPI0012DC8B7F|nr:hypothetical protein [Burkholderia multivorans]MBU9232955.1 hypothetical protein [Burkholderia multivorans]QGR90556.1 hypothetical protein FOC30_06315 [Burkholderia multivorans]HEF4737783.1 hypothetical protein [Burkholderia multivorans]
MRATRNAGAAVDPFVGRAAAGAIARSGMRGTLRCRDGRTMREKRRLGNGGMRIARGIAAWRAFYRARGARPGNRRRRAEDGRLTIERERQRARRAA